MNIMLMFSGQSVIDNPQLFEPFKAYPSSDEWIKLASQKIGFDLYDSANIRNNAEYLPILISAYQHAVMSVIKPTLNGHDVQVCGYSLGEVNAFLCSVNADVNMIFNVVSQRTRMMVQKLGNEPYDLLSIRGVFDRKKIQLYLDQYHCDIAIVNGDSHIIVGGQKKDLYHSKYILICIL